MATKAIETPDVPTPASIGAASAPSVPRAPMSGADQRAAIAKLTAATSAAIASPTPGAIRS